MREDVLGLEPVQHGLLLRVRLLARGSFKERQVTIQQFVEVLLFGFHSISPREARSRRFKYALDRYRLTAMVPRVVPSNFAICASLYSCTYRRIRTSAAFGFSSAMASYSLRWIAS